MRIVIRALLLLVVLAGLAAGVGYFLAGREPGPAIEIKSPEKIVGQNGSLELFADAPGGTLSVLEATIEQNGQSYPVFDLDTAAAEGGQVKQETADRLWVIRPLGKKTVPQLVAGPATIRVRAARPVFFGLRVAESSLSRDVTVRLEPPRVSVVSLHHFVNLGGAEFVVLRATPVDVEAGIRVGDASYPAYPGSAAGLADPALRVAFFALRWDQDASTPVMAYARDPGGSEATVPVDHKPFPKRFQQSKIPIDQRFLDRVVPAIASNTPDLTVDTSTPESRLQAFLTINGELRRKNADAITALAAKSAPQLLFRDAFAQMGNSQVESRFADQRTYFFGDKQIDKQVHLGFDLATVQQDAVHASNRGTVLFADFLGIYGNCVIVDHGLGVQSLYAHLSSIGVKPGDTVEKGQELGRTGATGLAGGDHLHFTMLLQGVPVNPVEWWDPHWLQDRVFRKITEAGGTLATP
jgi:murein DD-endopeptidase MepM/ murein hydrolase activator NlpD